MRLPAGKFWERRDAAAEDLGRIAPVRARDRADASSSSAHPRRSRRWKRRSASIPVAAAAASGSSPASVRKRASRSPISRALP